MQAAPKQAWTTSNGLLLRTLLLTASLWVASPVLGDVTDLLITESGDDAVLTWATGAAPWRVLRSESPNFFSGNQLVATGLAVPAFTDVDALAPGRQSYFYLVLEGGQANPPGFEANQPLPVPFISNLTPDTGSPGDVVTIEGGNFDPTGTSMVVTFNGLYADILTLSATELTVEVPAGALTGDVQVCRVVCSNRVPFKVRVGPEFEELSSIAFEAGTGSLWVAERGVDNTVYEIDPTGTVFARGSIANPVLAHPSPSDGNGRIYYGNSTLSTFNTGGIEFIDSATNGKGFLVNAGTPETDPAACYGIAANDLEPNVAYFLNGIGGGGGNHVRRVLPGPGDDFSYGNRPFTFNDPSGARFDSSGNLYISSTSEIYRILAGETAVELVADGFTAAAGFDLSEASGVPILLVADEATGTIWLVNGETGAKEVVATDFTGPVGAVFSEDLVTGELFYDVAEPTQILRLPDPRLEFLEQSEVRVLMSKQGMSDSYPSSNQTQNGQIRVDLKVIDKVDPAGTTVYFRLVDPKDPSRYLNGQQGDNLPASPAGTVTPSAIVGADGIASAVLTIDPQYAGNNYRIEAGLDPPPGFKKMARSKGYSSWRRLYVEHDKMYKEGEFLTQTSGAGQPNPERVFVANPAIFSVGDEVHVLSGDSIAHSEGEFGMVAAVGADFVGLQAPLILTYSEPLDPPNNSFFPYSFLARRAGGTYDVQPTATELGRAFEDAFTEWFLLPDSGFIPYWEHAELGLPAVPPGSFVAARTFLFFRNFDRSMNLPFQNHVQVVSATRWEATPPPANAAFGRTDGDGGASNWSWILDETISLSAPSNIQNVRNYVVAHELGHQLNVNQGSPQGGGHDEETAIGATGMCQPGTSGPSCCLMNPSTAPNTPGVQRFHASPGAPSEDLFCIRTHVDDLNQDQCP